jgi:hypothetical protein
MYLRRLEMSGSLHKRYHISIAPLQPQDTLFLYIYSSI